MPTSTQKLHALAPSMLHRLTAALSDLMGSHGVPGFLQKKLLDSARSKAEAQIGEHLAAGPAALDQLLGTVAGWCAGFRSDDNPISADELPAPFGVEELREVATALRG